jgi:hypothetical protein
VPLAAFVQDRQQQGGCFGQQHSRSSGNPLPTWTGPVPCRGAGVRTSAAAACGLLVVASACCPPRPRSGRLQVGTAS